MNNFEKLKQKPNKDMLDFHNLTHSICKQIQYIKISLKSISSHIFSRYKLMAKTNKINSPNLILLKSILELNEIKKKKVCAYVFLGKKNLRESLITIVSLKSRTPLGYTV